MTRPRVYAINYKVEAPDSSWFNRGFFLHDVPRMIPWCRWRGHRPVVDGYDQPNNSSRWVVCDRCGVRPEPQGHLDPKIWQIGQRYAGSWMTNPPLPRQYHLLKNAGFHDPGHWPRHPVGELGGQLVLGPLTGGIGAGVELGCAGNEHTLAAQLHSPLISLYLHTTGHGTWLQRRLNSTGYENREIVASIDFGLLSWTIWADRMGSDRDLPRWRSGAVRINPLDLLFGEKRYSYDDTGDTYDQISLPLPHGDTHPVDLRLQRVRYGRRPKWWAKHHWSVRWEIPGGVSIRPGELRGAISSSVWVSDDAVQAGTWVFEALASIALRLTHDRTQHHYPVIPGGIHAD